MERFEVAGYEILRGEQGLVIRATWWAIIKRLVTTCLILLALVWTMDVIWSWGIVLPGLSIPKIIGTFCVAAILSSRRARRICVIDFLVNTMRYGSTTYRLDQIAELELAAVTPRWWRPHTHCLDVRLDDGRARHLTVVRKPRDFKVVETIGRHIADFLGVPFRVFCPLTKERNPVFTEEGL